MALTLDNYIQSYGATPVHKARRSDDDRLMIMFCEIKVWKANKDDWWNPTNYVRFTEVQSVEIKKCYKNIIQTAHVTFPRGSIIGHRLKQNDGVKTGDGTKNTEETQLKNANGGDGADTIVPGSSLYESGELSGEGVLSINATRMDDGVIKVAHEDDKGLLTPNDVAIGNRIEIRMAYAYNNDDYLQYKEGLISANLVFTGFITKCSVDNPINIDCEDMMCLLKKVPCPENIAKKNYTVNDYLGNGAFHLLDNTGLTLDTTTRFTDINVGKVNMSDDLVVADVISEWSKCGLYVFMNENTTPPSIRVGRVFTSGYNYGEKGNIVKASGGVNIIQFDWDVANDGLKAFNTDKHYLAVDATGMNKDGEYFKLTIRKAEDGKWDVVNERKPISRKTGKEKTNKTASTKNTTLLKKPKLDLDEYTRVPYISPTVPITRDALIKEAESYYTKFNPNGVNGTLTLFGDRKIDVTSTVGLIDPRHPERNGFYFVDTVNTTFSVSGGYRVEIKLPYKLSSFPDAVSIERI